MNKQFSIFLTLFVLTTHCLSQNPSWDWVKSTADPSGSSNSGNAITTDLDGNVLVTGEFSGQETFGNTTLTGNGNADFFIAKYNSAGTMLWAKGAGGNLDDFGKDVATDQNGNIYVIGSFNSNNITFGNITLTNFAQFQANYFVVKYSSAGNVLWAISGGAYTEGGGITTDQLGNVIITGKVLAGVNPNQYDILVRKFDPNGNELWVNEYGGGYTDIGYGIACDNHDNIYVTGYFYSTVVQFGDETLTNSDIFGGEDFFITKLDSTGTPIWARSAGSEDHREKGYGIVTDIYGNVNVVGHFESQSVTFGSIVLTKSSPSNFKDIFLVQYDSIGNVQWASSSGAIKDYSGLLFEGPDIASDTEGNIYVAGFFNTDSIVFDGVSLINYPGVNQRSDAYLTKYDNSGTVLWALGLGNDPRDDVAYGVATDEFQSVYITGYTQNLSMTFGQTAIANINSPNDKLFVAKLCQVLNPSITSNGQSMFCTGESVELFSSSAIGNLWSPGGETSQSIIVTESGDYSITITNQGGCSATSDAITITVNDLPTPEITVNGTTTFCEGATTLTSNYGQGNQWMLNGNNLMGENLQTFNPMESGFYSLHVIDVNSCEETSSTISLTVNPLPDAAITASGPVSVCEGDSVELSVQQSDSYSWSTGATDQSIMVYESGDYYVSVSGANGCVGVSDETTVTVHDLPNEPIITQNGNVLMSSASTGNQWYLNGEPINGATSQFYTVTESGFYSVSVTDNFTCSNSSVTVSVVITGIQMESELNIVIHPNPASHTIAIDGYFPEYIKLFNAIGQCILNTSKTNNIRVYDLAEGMYTLQLFDDKRQLVRTERIQIIK